MIETITVRSRDAIELIDITDSVAACVRRGTAGSGMCHLFVPHTTAGITVNEHADPDVRTDLEAFFRRVVPAGITFRHAEGNSVAHILTSLVGSDLAIPIDDNELLLGQWQGVYLCEFDGPRERSITLAIRKDRV